MLSQLLPTTRIRYKAVLAVIERPGPYFQGGLNVILEASAQLLSTTRIRYKAAFAVIGRPGPYFQGGLRYHFLSCQRPCTVTVNHNNPELKIEKE